MQQAGTVGNTPVIVLVIICPRASHCNNLPPSWHNDNILGVITSSWLVTSTVINEHCTGHRRLIIHKKYLSQLDQYLWHLHTTCLVTKLYSGCKEGIFLLKPGPNQDTGTGSGGQFLEQLPPPAISGNRSLPNLLKVCLDSWYSWLEMWEKQAKKSYLLKTSEMELSFAWTT